MKITDKEERIGMRINPSEKKQWAKQAKKMDLTLTGFIKFCVKFFLQKKFDDNSQQ